jgi:hypothetical protein
MPEMGTPVGAHFHFHCRVGVPQLPSPHHSPLTTRSRTAFGCAQRCRCGPSCHRHALHVQSRPEAFLPQGTSEARRVSPDFRSPP